MPRYKITLIADFDSEAMAKTINELLQDCNPTIESIEALAEKVDSKEDKPFNGYVFLWDDDAEEGEVERFFITDLEYWNKNLSIDDGPDMRVIKKLLPPNFHECMEACFEYDGTGNPWDVLKSYGFREVKWGKKLKVKK